MDTTIQVQILDKAVCISHNTNTLGKDRKLTILPPAMVNSRADQALGMGTRQGEEKLKIQTR